MAHISRAGRYVKQTAGYEAFIPAPLPPDPPIVTDSLEPLLSEAAMAVGRLDGAASALLNPDLFVAMYVRREAVLSSQIEGTQSTLEDLLTYELEETTRDPLADVQEVVNYVAAMNHGLKRVADLPPSGRLIREIHEVLLRGGRGAERSPGSFRTTQNWIGPGGVPLSRASFVPPPVHEMLRAFSDLERFLNTERKLPVLIHCGIAHAQFETIHPFLDGNGRVGRLLITFVLVYRDVLTRPLLYLSHYLKERRAEYYDRLMAVRNDGDWEGWLRFFLRGVRDTAQEAVASIQAINSMREEHHRLIRAGGFGGRAGQLLDLLFLRPIINVSFVEQELGISFNTASRVVQQLQSLQILEEATTSRRNRRFHYKQYLDLFPTGPATPASLPAAETTSSQQ
jgi:Fic family protein